MGKPKKGFEPLTPALRKRCSAVELLRRLERIAAQCIGHLSVAATDAASSLLTVSSFQIRFVAHPCLRRSHSQLTRYNELQTAQPVREFAGYITRGERNAGLVFGLGGGFDEVGNWRGGRFVLGTVARGAGFILLSAPILCDVFPLTSLPMTFLTAGHIFSCGHVSAPG